MAYVAKNWTTNEVITSTALNNIENGVANLDAGNIATLHQTAPVQAVALRFAASDTIRDSADTSVIVSSTTYTQIFSTQVPLYYVTGAHLRIKFDLMGDGGYPVTVYGQIYINGAAVGTERSNATSEWITYSEDIPVNPGDTVEVWARTSLTSTTYTHEISNIRVCCTDSIYLGIKDAAW